MSLSVDINPAVYGQVVTFQSSGDGTNIVGFFFDGVLYATRSTPYILIYNAAVHGAGTHAVEAFLGDGMGGWPTSQGTVSFVVNKATPVIGTGFDVSPTEAYHGRNTITSTITAASPGGGTPTGTVEWFVNATSLGTGSLSSSQAVLSTVVGWGLDPGTYTLDVSYYGDANFDAGTGTAVLIIGPNVGVHFSSDSIFAGVVKNSVYGQQFHFIVLVSVAGTWTYVDTSAFASGTITIKHPNGAILHTATLAADMVVQTLNFNVDSRIFGAGDFIFRVEYSGDSTYTPFIRVGYNPGQAFQHIEKADTQVILRADPFPVGTASTFDATVKILTPSNIDGQPFLFGTLIGNVLLQQLNPPLVQDGSFDVGSDITDYWYYTGDTGFSFYGDGRINPLTTACWQAGPSDLGFMTQIIVTQTLDKYTLSLWLKSTFTAPSNQFLVWWNGRVLYDVSGVPDMDWTELTFPVVSEGCDELIIGFKNPASYFYIDDVTVTKIGGTTPPLLTANGTMGPTVSDTAHSLIPLGGTKGRQYFRATYKDDPNYQSRFGDLPPCRIEFRLRVLGDDVPLKLAVT
jgi:hypothetical protein